MDLYNDYSKVNIKISFVERLFTEAVNNASEIRKLTNDTTIDQEAGDLKNEQYIHIIFKFINFFLHLTDRHAYGKMSEEQRSILMDELEKTCITLAVKRVCPSWPKNEKEKFKDECLKILNEDTDEFSKYKNIFGLGSLSYNFGKIIAKLANKEDDALYILATNELISKRNLDIGSFINDIINL